MFSLIFGISYFHTLWHEFSHAISMVLNGGFFDRIELDFYSMGLTHWGVGSSFNLIQLGIVYVSGLIGEIVLGIFLIFLLRFKLKDKNKLNDLLVIIIIGQLI